MTAEQSFEIVPPDRPMTRSEGLAIVNLIDRLWDVTCTNGRIRYGISEFTDELKKLKEQLS